MPHLTTNEAKIHLRVDHDEEDPLIDAYVLAAVSWLQSHTGRHIDQKAALVEYVDLDDVAEGATGDFVYLGNYPIDGESVTVETEDGALVNPDDFTVEVEESGRARVEFVDGVDLGAHPLKFTYTAGYADGELPAPLKAAALLVVGSLYDSRGGGDIPRAAESLADPYKVRIFAGA